MPDEMQPVDAGLIETGRLVNTHGIHGRLRLQPWADSPSSLTGIGHLYIDGVPVKVLSAEVHKGFVLVSLEGVDSMDAAIRLKNKVVSVRRADIAPDKGTYFIADLIGLSAIDADTGDEIGKIADVLTLPAHNVYVIKGVTATGRGEILVPAVEKFIKETNLEERYVKIKLIEGL